jgi:hypothetical protein
VPKPSTQEPTGTPTGTPAPDPHSSEQYDSGLEALGICIGKRRSSTKSSQSSSSDSHPSKPPPSLSSKHPPSLSSKPPPSSNPPTSSILSKPPPSSNHPPSSPSSPSSSSTYSLSLLTSKPSALSSKPPPAANQPINHRLLFEKEVGDDSNVSAVEKNVKKSKRKQKNLPSTMANQQSKVTRKKQKQSHLSASKSKAKSSSNTNTINTIKSKRQITISQCCQFFSLLMKSPSSPSLPTSLPSSSIKKCKTKAIMHKEASAHRASNQIFVGATVYTCSIKSMDFEVKQEGKKRSLRKAIYGKVIESVTNNCDKVLLTNGEEHTLKSSLLHHAPADYSLNIGSASLKSVFKKAEKHNDVSLLDNVLDLDLSENNGDVEDN